LVAIHTRDLVRVIIQRASFARDSGILLLLRWTSKRRENYHRIMSSQAFHPLKSSAPLIVYIDYKSPYAYLAIAPTCAMQDELGIAIDWRPFTLDIPSYLGSARLNKEGKVVEENRAPGQWLRVKYAYRDVRRYGVARGIIVRGTEKIWDSSLAGIGMLWAKAQSDAMFRAYTGIVYERFWKRELDIEDIGVIERVLTEAGARSAGFREYASGEGRALHDNIQTATFDAGIFGVPTYIINGEKFFGREHLPRVRWMLTGRVGAPPDITYAEPCTTRASDRRLSVTIDFKSPQAYLAIAPTLAMADELGIEIDWLPMVTGQSPAPPTGNDRGARHRRIRADYLDRDVARYAAARGLEIRGFDRPRDSSLAAIGLLWAKRQDSKVARTYAERVFERYGREAIDLEDENAIRALLAEIGAPVSGFEAFAKDDGRAALARIQSELREAGAFEVPTYLLNGEIYLGRQHLPRIRSMLS
jgi:2-hydroxychromene-2-carboxylate isomerase